MDKLLLGTDSDDLNGDAQRLSIIKYTKENNIKLNTMEGNVRQNTAGFKFIIDMLKEMMRFDDANFRTQNKNQADIKNGLDSLIRNFMFINERREEQAKVQHGLLERIAKGLGGVPRDTMMMAAAAPVARRAF
jgi:hypothetical protein